MLQQARDEAHRFAVTFQRQKRAARTITSELLRIPGIGPHKRRALLHVFGSVQGVKDAAVEDIARVPGFGVASARKVLQALGVPLPIEVSSNTTADDSVLPESAPPAGDPGDAPPDVFSPPPPRA
jgi:excinuclease ABC subunit C